MRILPCAARAPEQRGHAWLPATRSELVRLGGVVLEGLEEEEEREFPDDVRVGNALRLIVSAMAVRLMPLGWAVETHPGEEVVFRRNGQELRPYSELAAAADQKVGAGNWLTRCTALGIADVPLRGSAAIA